MDHLCALQRDFINLRLGTFIHWNSAAVQFHANPDIIDWEFDLENGGEPRRYPFPESDWAPRAPDCDRWAQIAKSAGCRFAVLTAKHHEGFALWPSEFGNHSVAQATVRTDIVSEFLRAFRAAGLQAGLYFSVLDLTAGIGRRSFPPAQRELVLGQITELLTNYGEIPYLIIDGWNAPWGGPSYRELPFEEVDALVKRLQPNCLLMNIGCTEGISGMLSIAVQALIIRGMSNFAKEFGGLDWLVAKFEKFINSRKSAEVGIGVLTGLVDVSMGNNTIAILVSSQVAMKFARKYNIAAKRVASLLDISACVVQSFIPHGGQMMLCMSLTALSPVAIAKVAFYPWLLGLAALVTILFGLMKTPEEKEGKDLYAGISEEI